jgi:hypothetical protein
LHEKFIAYTVFPSSATRDSCPNRAGPQVCGDGLSIESGIAAAEALNRQLLSELPEFIGEPCGMHLSSKGVLRLTTISRGKD